MSIDNEYRWRGLSKWVVNSEEQRERVGEQLEGWGHNDLEEGRQPPAPWGWVPARETATPGPCLLGQVCPFLRAF